MDYLELAYFRALHDGGGGSDITVEPLNVAANGTITAPAGKAYSPVNVAVPPLGVESKAVNFIDYDGTIIYAYSAQDFAALTELPPNPTHPGLTAQGWNWTLAGAKGYVARNGFLDIGQSYITDDGTTRLYIHLEPGRLSPVLGVCPNGTVDVDWGDGSAHDTATGGSTSVNAFVQHTYAAPGDYVIRLSVTGQMGFAGESRLLTATSVPGNSNGNSAYRAALRKLEIGAGVESIQQLGWYACLQTITVPVGITRVAGQQGFVSCYSLRSLTLPAGFNKYSGMGAIGTYSYCTSLSSVSFPEGCPIIKSTAFVHSSSLRRLALPEGTWSGNAASLFNGCNGLEEVTPLPHGLTGIVNAFADCFALHRVELPDTLTAIDGSFQNCAALASVTIPATVTAFGNNAFNGCTGLGVMRLLPTTPPTLGTDALTSIGDSCIFYVPSGSLATYQAAEGWSAYAAQMVEAA